MAARSITVSQPLETILQTLRRLSAGSLEERPLQNGVRVALSLDGARTALNVYPGKTGGCKVVFDQPDAAAADRIASALEGVPSAPSAAKKKVSEEIAPVLEGVACWLGSDESGKGDYFGPLVTAAVALRLDQWPVLQELGVRDSKALGDQRIVQLARTIAEAFPSKIVTIMPERYNQLVTEMRTVNRVLAWAHARAIEDLLADVPDATAAVADQFGDASLIERALMQKGRSVRLVQMHRAERDPAVAAASILARAEFLRRLRALERRYDLPLPRGAGAGTDAAGRQFVARHGADALAGVAKTHFKNTQRVLGAGGPKA